jgi:hypothetical protein
MPAGICCLLGTPGAQANLRKSFPRGVQNETGVQVFSEGSQNQEAKQEEASAPVPQPESNIDQAQGEGARFEEAKQEEAEKPAPAPALQPESDMDHDALAAHQQAAPGSLDRPKWKNYAENAKPLEFDEIVKLKLLLSSKLNKLREKAADDEETEVEAPKKQVLMVIDVQDGYDSAYIGALEPNVPGGLAYITKPHDVTTAFELESRAEIKTFAPGEKRITYDKKWNRGLPDDSMTQVVDRVLTEIKSGQYSMVVFTHDYLEASDCGVFAIDATPWSDPKKPIALVPYSEYLTLTSNGAGSDIHRTIRDAFPGLTGKSSQRTTEEVCGAKTLFLRKQVDDAFDDSTEQSDRTEGKVWLDDIDVTEEGGLPHGEAQTLLQKLEAAGYGPGDTVLSFCGVVTNRCVASSLIHSVTHGYDARLLVGGCRAASDEEHELGVQLIRDKCGNHVEVLP